MLNNHENPCFSVGQSELVDNCVGRRTIIETKTKTSLQQKLSDIIFLKGIRSLSAENTSTQTHR